MGKPRYPIIIIAIAIILIGTIILTYLFFSNNSHEITMSASEWNNEYNAWAERIYEGERPNFPSLNPGDTVLVTGNVTSITVIYPMVDIEIDGVLFPLPFEYNVTNNIGVGDNVSIVVQIIKGDNYSLFSYEEGIGFEGELGPSGTIPSSDIIKNEA